MDGRTFGQFPRHIANRLDLIGFELGESREMSV